jgi:soluble lytic murein transglycosylase-like protein
MRAALFIAVFVGLAGFGAGTWANDSYRREIAAFGIEAPHVQAMLEHAFAAQIGHGQTRSPLRAAMLYCDAAREGSAEAYYRLARLFLMGDGVGRNLPVAASLLSVAARFGHERAAQALELTGVREEQLPECLSNPETAWAEANGAGYVDIEKYADSLPADRMPVVRIIRRLAPRYDVDQRFALSIAAVESNFNSKAVSPKNAQGVMQLIPDTAERFNVKNPFHPEQNIRGGLAYLRWLLKRFDNDLRLVAAAYNAGEGAVERYGGIPPYAETQAYVRRVVQFMPPPTLQEVRRAVRGGLP